MKKKSLFDIAMEQKREKQNNDNNIVITHKNSRISVVVEIIGKIFKVLFYILICLLLTIGTTVLVNNELREQLINVVNLNL
ncbi:MAG TPA: hypothetical protein DCZ30_02000 [Clostridiales bacterium]|nr:hypothetical protein [Clostridiales bacterium]